MLKELKENQLVLLIGLLCKELLRLIGLFLAHLTYNLMLQEDDGAGGETSLCSGISK